MFRPYYETSSLTRSVTNISRLLRVVAYTQKSYFVLLGGTTQMDESSWLNGERRGEAPPFAVWFFVKNICLVPLVALN
jgi:hypothetical protein